jgi:hypothetical protein
MRNRLKEESNFHPIATLIDITLNPIDNQGIHLPNQQLMNSQPK